MAMTDYGCAIKERTKVNLQIFTFGINGISSHEKYQNKSKKRTEFKSLTSF